MKVTIPPISTKRTSIPHHSTLNTNKKNTQKFDIGNPGPALGQVQKITNIYA
jgi:hypothetical protein